MDLIHNSVFQVCSGELAGIYRVVFDYPEQKKTVAMRIDDLRSPLTSDSDAASPGPRHCRANSKKGRKTAKPLVGAPLWLDRNELIELAASNELRPTEIVLDGVYALPLNESLPPGAGDNERAGHQRQQEMLKKRLSAMEPFLDLALVRESLLEHGNFSALVAHATKAKEESVRATQTGELSPPEKPNLKASRGLVYKCLSLLARYGFHESSLRLRFDRSGAKGVARPCDPGGRKKAGALTERQRQAKLAGLDIPEPEQPGMSSEWRTLVMWADSRIIAPKPKWSRRCELIVELAFVRKLKEEDGKLIRVLPNQGEYPNEKQIKNVIQFETPRLQQLRDKTTKGHFDRAMRGLRGKNWQGVSGPGHTWAIDSTVGDIYLRSSIKRSWIIGRPIVYILVDVWSTAVVGFYVCLRGPSWDMAKVSLFCSASNPELIADLWGYEYLPTLFPTPTLPWVLMCDRGEYLSKAARQTGMALQLNESFAPPYRPDLKGLVEVLHRIAKDEQFEFVPGSIDARMVELERRRFDPHSAVFTVREYVQHLYLHFYKYNLTADRRHRLDSQMLSDGVIPSPAGLWRWGHSVGIGFRRHVDHHQLATDLLPHSTLTVSRSGVEFARGTYSSDETREERWTEFARNFGVGSKRHCYFFPGSTSRIWTPNLSGKGLLELSLDDHSKVAPDATFDEVADVYKHSLQSNASRAHEVTVANLDVMAKQQDNIDQAKKLTAEAIRAESEPAPTMTDARNLESETHCPSSPTSLANPTQRPLDRDNEFSAMLDSILNSTAEAEVAHA